jgi:hypothetical protein
VFDDRDVDVHPEIPKPEAGMKAALLCNLERIVFNM